VRHLVAGVTGESVHPLGLLIAICALFGLAVGSFLHVVIYRVPRHESVVSPPSACPSRGAQITPRDNIPVVSWLLLRGRCRHCQAPISWQYPAVELATAALFAGLAPRLIAVKRIRRHQQIPTADLALDTAIAVLAGPELLRLTPWGTACQRRRGAIPWRHLLNSLAVDGPTRSRSFSRPASAQIPLGRRRRVATAPQPGQSVLATRGLQAVNVSTTVPLEGRSMSTRRCSLEPTGAGRREMTDSDRTLGVGIGDAEHG
jgi:Bacterial Peptidase A24 N-terminal domain